MRLDVLSLFGILLSLGAVIAGHMLEGGHMRSLLQPTAFLIVIGGTLGAVMVQSPMSVFLRGLKMSGWIFMPPTVMPDELIAQIVTWSNTSRREGLLALETQVAKMDDPFMQKGVQLLIDGVYPDRLRDLMEVEISAWENDLKQCARIWEAAGGYAPTIGILGAVMGLIHVMENLSDPSKLGAGIAVAFVATIYGVASANLLFLPISKKLFALVGRMATVREMLVDGLVCIANGENPRVIETRLRGYIQFK